MTNNRVVGTAAAAGIVSPIYCFTGEREVMESYTFHSQSENANLLHLDFHTLYFLVFVFGLITVFTFSFFYQVFSDGEENKMSKYENKNLAQVLSHEKQKVKKAKFIIRKYIFFIYE